MKGVLMMNFGKKMAVGVASAALVASLAGAPAAFAGVGDEIKFPDGGSFTRVSGDSRIDTALAVAEKLYKDSNSSLKTAYLVSSRDENMVDAATSGMLKDGIVLLVPSDRSGQLLLGATMKTKFPNVSKLVAVGGKKAVADEAVAAVKKMNDKITKTERLDGKNRYETNVAVAKASYKSYSVSRVYLTRGDQLVDALTAGAAGDGPVLLVNHEGDVDKATKEYFEKLTLSADGVVLGGKSALSEEQVNKILGETKKLDPWSYLKTTAEKKADVQRAAAVYFGQDKWQRMGKGFIEQKYWDPKKVDEYNYFGNGYTGSAVVGESKDPSTVNVSVNVTDPKKVFIGYKDSTEKLGKNVLALTNKHTALQADLDVALRNAIAGKAKAGEFVGGNAIGGTEAEALLNAVKAMYGVSSQAAGTTFKKGKLSDGGAFTFDSDTDEITGLNTDFFKGIESKLSSGDWSEVKAYKIGTKPATLGGAVYLDIDSNASNVHANDPVPAGKPVVDGVNYDALFNQATSEYKSQKEKADKAKKDLVDAVNLYFGKERMNLVTQEGTWPRLAGKDRYETSALLAVYSLLRGSYLHQDKVDPVNGRAYLASGDDAHLIDSVVAGQLTDGPIMLVPTSGKISEPVLKHLAYLKYRTTNLGTFAIGGKLAISDEVRDEAVKALRNAKDYAGADYLGEVGKKQEEAALQLVDGSNKAVENVDMPESGVTLNLTAKLTDKSAVPVLNSTVSVKKNNVASTDLTATVSNNNTLTIAKGGAPLNAGDVYTVSVKDGDNNTAQVTVTIKADTVTLDDKTVTLDDKTATWTNAFDLPLKLNGQAATSATTGLQINGKNSGTDATAPTVADDGANGKVKVTVTPGTTKFGTYTIKGKLGTKDFSAKFTYQAGKPTEVTGVASGADKLFEVGETNAAVTVTNALALDKDGKTVSGATVSQSGSNDGKVKVATANLTNVKYLYIPQNAASKPKLFEVK
ncbi:cell wall-binding repeat-containing protein [Mobiluncus mulieris]|uniref:Cell wall-binding repeat-containing protein n=2 Tax=Mobiluncus mulieris TaxID=2052 RepID=A0A7Y0UVD9_9ACTO|nr:cell wall-binding repeat-containing protein [Mobiluncus mulieris]